MPDIDALIRAQQGDPSGLTSPAPAAVSASRPNAPQMDIMSIFRQLLSTPEVAAPRQAMEDQRSRLAGMESDYANMPLPATGPKNLALRILSATRPGQAISDAVYAPGINRYEMQRQQLASRIAALKGQTDISQDEAKQATALAGTAGTAGYRTGELQLGAEKNEIARQRAQAFSDSVKNKLAMGTRALDLNALRTGSTLELNKAKIALDNVLSEVLPRRADLQEYGIDQTAYVRQAVADLEAQSGLEKEHPFLNLLDQSLGTHLMPSAPQTPGGAQPVRGDKPLPPKTPVKQNKKVLTEQPDGTFK